MSLIRNNSAWDLAEIERFFASTAIPLRLGCLTSDQKPLVSSLWYLYDDGALWCATQASSSVAQLLGSNPACGFEVAPEQMPYRGVRGQGNVRILESEGLPLLLRLVDRYLGTRDTEFARWLIKLAATDEVALRIEPDWLTAWDFSARMQPQAE